MVDLDFQIIDITKENMEEYDLFCQKSRHKEPGYQNKLQWMTERLEEGLKLKLLRVNERGRFTSRGFIEYVPGDYTWRGIKAPGWMVIHCIWVVGKHKKKGYGTKLLEHCLKDAEKMKGVVVMTNQKGHWLPKEDLFIKNGFEKVDDFPPTFELYVKRFSEKATDPSFYDCPPEKIAAYDKGITIFYTYQCPYYYNMIEQVKEFGEKLSIPVKTKLLTTPKEAQQNGIHPNGIFFVVLNGKILTYERTTPRQLKKFFKRRGVEVPD